MWNRRVGGKSPERRDRDLATVLQRAKEQLQQMIDMHPQVLLLMRDDGTVARTNRALLDLAGLTDFREALGRRLGEIFPAGDKAFFDRMLRKHKGLAMHEARIRLAQGAERDLRFTVVGSGRDADLSVVMVSDVTEAKRQTARDEKRFKSEAVTALMGGLMHSINQPLTVITVSTRLMETALDKGDVDKDALKGHLRTISDLVMQVKELLQRVAELHDFVTENYVGNIDILDIEGSTGGGDGSGRGEP